MSLRRLEKKKAVWNLTPGENKLQFLLILAIFTSTSSIVSTSSAFPPSTSSSFSSSSIYSSTSSSSSFSNSFQHLAQALRPRTSSLTQEEAVRQLLLRLFPASASSAASKFNITVDSSSSDSFTVFATEGFVQIRGSTGVDAAAGLFYYLKANDSITHLEA